MRVGSHGALSRQATHPVQNRGVTIDAGRAGGPACGPPRLRAAWLSGVALAIGILTTLAAFAAAIAGFGFGGTDQVTMVAIAVIVRTVCAVAIIALLVRAGVRRVGGSALSWALAALGGYAFNLFAWQGNALFVAVLVGGAVEQSAAAKVVGVVGDAVVWAGVAALSARRFGPRPARAGERSETDPPVE